MDTHQKILITPDTRLYELLSAFPELEQELMEMSPVFQNLKNPVLRKTIARVATISQMATMAKIPVAKLVNDLRRKAGQAGTMEEQQGTEKLPEPAWVMNPGPAMQLDARALISSGGHPLQQVLQETKNLKPGEVYLLITPFLPLPLIEKMEHAGFGSWAREIHDQELFQTYFLKR